MDDSMILVIMGYFVTLIAIVTPIIKLSSTITNLDTTLKILIKRTDEDRCELKETTRKANYLYDVKDK